MPQWPRLDLSPSPAWRKSTSFLFLFSLLLFLSTLNLLASLNPESEKSRVTRPPLSLSPHGIAYNNTHLLSPE